jgi:molybdenum cofactor cytidylyltransferase
VGDLELDPPAARRQAEAVISAVVLAAGTSSRFGRTKQLVEIGGKALAQHAVDAAAGAGLDEIVVVLGHDADAVRAALELPANGQTALNPRYLEGQSTSLAVGLEVCDPSSEAAIVLLADQPGIRADHVRALVAAYGETRAEILRLRFRDGPGPALLARAVWPEVMVLAGDTGARALFQAQPERVRWFAIDEDAPPDIDTPDDLP